MHRRLAFLLSAIILTLAACSPSPTLVPPTSTPVPATATPAPPTPAPTPASAALNTVTSVAFVSSTQGWVLGGDCDGSGASNCSVWATSDGGKAWAQQYRSPLVLEQVTFLNATTGWVLGRITNGCSGLTEACPSAILATTDGGKTWTTREPGKIALSHLEFQNSTEGWALETTCPAGPNGRCIGDLRKTSDGGATWAASPIPGVDVTGFSFVGPLHGWAIGWSCAGPTAERCPLVISATTDGGKNWSRQFQNEQDYSTVAPRITFANLNDGWWLASGPAGCTMGGCWPALYQTTDGGSLYRQIQPADRWKTTSEPGYSGFPGTPKFINASVGWIPINAGAGPGVGGIALTMDGGKTWARVGANLGWSITGVSAVSAQDVWIVGEQSTPTGSSPLLLHSTDGGRNWLPELPKP
ncbi:MAG: hypothetical protein M1570_15495 [Chloroflexi bacterium]|nr:hypothetical protein [Chloroflexota bacterium]